MLNPITPPPMIVTSVVIFFAIDDVITPLGRLQSTANLEAFGFPGRTGRKRVPRRPLSSRCAIRKGRPTVPKLSLYLLYETYDHIDPRRRHWPGDSCGDGPRN